MPPRHGISQYDASFFLLTVQSRCNTLDICCQVDCVRAMKYKEPWKILIRNRLRTSLNVNGTKEPFRTHENVVAIITYHYNQKDYCNHYV